MKKILYIVSTGAGGSYYLSAEALKALQNSEVIIGYQKYLDDIENLLTGKEVHASEMTQEIKRCNLALQIANEGRVVALISNGDVNIYGMATLVFELAEEKKLFNSIEIVSIPGVTSFLAAASLVGAPISQDFSVISLSNRLTNLEQIEKRIEMSFHADFVLGIYNPLSNTRHEPFQIFLEKLQKFSCPKTPIIIAKNIGRKTQKIFISTASDFLNQWKTFEINMSTILIVGNSESRFIDSGKKVLTPRGYLKKYNSSGRRK